MNSINKYKLLYYVAAAVTALPVIIAILSILNWPLLAEVSLGAALLLHSLALAKTAKEAYRYIRDNGLLHEWIYSIERGVEMTDQRREY